MSHVRADRWYKLGRTILYGRLEDEAPFQSVRRLVEYEDYTLRLLRDIGIRTAAPYGIVELTPEREYLLVTEFFDGAKEIGEADVDDAVIDGRARVDPRSCGTRASPTATSSPPTCSCATARCCSSTSPSCRCARRRGAQAVDLANMMLVLAVRTDAERVYERALRFFTPDEIAEAFAAARGVASPTQLRTAMKEDGRDLLAQFRELAPRDAPIALQRWSVKRVALILGLALGALLVGSQHRPSCCCRRDSDTEDVDGKPELRHRRRDGARWRSRCRRRRRCRASPRSLPAGASGTSTSTADKTQFWLDSDGRREPCGRGVAPASREVLGGRRHRGARATRRACAASSGPSSSHRTSRSLAPTCSPAVASPTSSRSQGGASSLADVRR